jgi:cobalt-zinc-cadmium efflux system outer membrane protein
LLLGALSAAAQTTAPLKISLHDALQLAAEGDPRLQGQTFLRQGAAAREAHAGLRPAPKLSVEAENVLGTGTLSTFDETELTLSLGTTLELGGKRSSRKAVAARESERLEIELQAARLDVLADVAKHFIAVLQAQEMLRIAREDKALALRARQIVGNRINAGVALPVEGSNAEVASVQTDLAEKQAQSNLRATWGQLVIAWGGAPESSGEAAGDLFATRTLPPFAGLQDMIDRNPDILRFASERRVREAAVQSAEALAMPDVDVSAGIRRLQTSRDQAFVLSAAIPLGTAARAKPAADEARSKLGGLEAEEKARRNELLGTLYALRQRADMARDSLDLLQSSALPAAQRAQEQAETAFKAGRSSLLELNAAQRQLLELRRDKIETAASYHLLVIDIERLVGEPLATASGGLK